MPSPHLEAQKVRQVLEAQLTELCASSQSSTLSYVLGETALLTFCPHGDRGKGTFPLAYRTQLKTGSLYRQLNGTYGTIAETFS